MTTIPHPNPYASAITEAFAAMAEARAAGADLATAQAEYAAALDAYGVPRPSPQDPARFPRDCRRNACRCTHTGPCDYGWLNLPGGRVTPCPQCRPELSARITDAVIRGSRNVP